MGPKASDRYQSPLSETTKKYISEKISWRPPPAPLTSQLKNRISCPFTSPPHNLLSIFGTSAGLTSLHWPQRSQNQMLIQNNANIPSFYFRVINTDNHDLNKITYHIIRSPAKNGFPDMDISLVRPGTLTSPVYPGVVTPPGVVTSPSSDRATNRIGHPLLTSSMLNAEKVIFLIQISLF